MNCLAAISKGIAWKGAGVMVETDVLLEIWLLWQQRGL